MKTTLDDLRKLQPNWDSYGGKKIDPAAIDGAARILARMWYPASWHVIPCSDGSVQIESHSDGLDIEIHIARAESNG